MLLFNGANSPIYLKPGRSSDNPLNRSFTSPLIFSVTRSISRRNDRLPAPPRTATTTTMTTLMLSLPWTSGCYSFFGHKHALTLLLTHPALDADWGTNAEALAKVAARKATFIIVIQSEWCCSGDNVFNSRGDLSRSTALAGRRRPGGRLSTVE